MLKVAGPKPTAGCTLRLVRFCSEMDGPARLVSLSQQEAMRLI